MTLYQISIQKYYHKYFVRIHTLYYIYIDKSRGLRSWGRHEKPPPFLGRVLGHMLLYRESEGGGVEGIRTNT